MKNRRLAKIYYADLWGLREEKYKYLFGNDVRTTDWQELKPIAPYYFFVPKDFALQSEYEKFWKVTEIFKESQMGLMTGQDEFFIDANPQALKARILSVFNKSLNDENLKTLYNLKSQAGEKTIRARNSTDFNQNLIHLYCYRPFDTRYVYAENKFLWRSVEAIKKHLVSKNIALVTTRILAKLPFNHVFVAEHVGDNTLISNQTKERNYYFPLYLYLDEPEGRLFDEKEYREERISNFTPEFLQALKASLSLEPTPEEIFYYIYAVLYSPTYRKRYEEFLKIDFPRVPLPSNYGVFKELSTLGEQLVELHLLKAPALDETEIGFPKGGSNRVEKISYDEGGERVFVNKGQFFEGISKEVWEYRIGAYQVMGKYLKDRKKRKLPLDEIGHYMKMAKAIRLTIKLQGKIEEVYRKIKV